MRGIVWVLAALIGIGLVASSRAAEVRRPNIVFLLSDDQRWNSLGCMGNPVLKTPNLDALAHRGSLFTHACVSTSICCVSRSSILTGQYAARHGIHDFKTPLTPEALARTYPVLMRKAGYYTGFIGKYGVGSRVPNAFDYNCGTPQLTPQWVKGPDGKPVHVIRQDTDYALEFLRGRPQSKPFCLSLSWRAPHAEDQNPKQYLPEPQDMALYRDAKIPVPKTGDERHFQQLPPFLVSEMDFGRLRWHWRFDTPERYQEYVKNYYRLLTEIDRSVGEVVAELKREGVDGNTVVMFMGDNGYFLGEHGLADKWFPYEESIRVPLVVYDPRTPEKMRGHRFDELVLNVDVAPTLLTLAGLPVPSGMQGRDFSPVYRGEARVPWRTEFYYDHQVPIEGIEPSEALVSRDWKYIYWNRQNYEELFDLRHDPLEEHNLAREPQYQERKADLRRRMESRKREVSP